MSFFPEPAQAYRPASEGRRACTHFQTLDFNIESEAQERPRKASRHSCVSLLIKLAPTGVTRNDKQGCGTRDSLNYIIKIVFSKC